MHFLIAHLKYEMLRELYTIFPPAGLKASPKASSQIFAKIIWSKFHKNRPKIVAIRSMGRHTYTHPHTHAQTGLVPD